MAADTGGKVMNSPIEEALEKAATQCWYCGGSGMVRPTMWNGKPTECEVCKPAKEALTALSSGEMVVVLTSTLLKIRDALIKLDVSEAYHQLYLIADPECIKYEPWKEWEDAQCREEG